MTVSAELGSEQIEEDNHDYKGDDIAEAKKDRAVDDWKVFALEFRATWARAVHGMRLASAGPTSTRLESSADARGIGREAGAAHRPLQDRPSNCTRILLNVVGIICLSQAWAGFLSLVVGLYLLSAASWLYHEDAPWTIMLLAICGLSMLVGAVVGFVYSRRANALYGGASLSVSIAVQAAGVGLVFGFDLPFAVQAAIGVLGLQLAPLALALIVYIISECAYDRNGAE